MIKPSLLFHGFSGINNITKPSRIGISENGFVGLEAASNVFVNVDGSIETVPEGVIKLAGIFHSVWGMIDKFYCVKDEISSSTIYQGELVDGVLSMRTVVTGLTLGRKVSYASLGTDVYYSNGSDHGYIAEVTHYAWPTQKNVRLPELVTFTPGTHIDVLAGRMLSIDEGEVKFSEVFLPGLYNAYKNRRRLSSTGIMVRSVGTGAYVSDNDCVYFLHGVNPNEWKLERVLEYPAIEYGHAPRLVDPSFFGFQSRQLALLFNTVYGVCIGLPTGEVHNLMDKRYRKILDYDAMTVLNDSLAILSSLTGGVLVQGTSEDVGNKSVTEWTGGFNSLFVNSSGEVIGANDSGLSLIWGQSNVVITGLEMLDGLEMLNTLGMI